MSMSVTRDIRQRINGAVTIQREAAAALKHPDEYQHRAYWAARLAHGVQLERDARADLHRIQLQNGYKGLIKM